MLLQFVIQYKNAIYFKKKYYLWLENHILYTIELGMKNDEIAEKLNSINTLWLKK